MSGTAYDAAYAKRAAENYERYFVPAIGAPVAEDLVQAAALRPGASACWTSPAARAPSPGSAAEEVGPEGAVAGLDPNPAMLAVARETAPSEAAIAWHEAPAEAIPLPDESFDVVLCGMGLQFFSDRRAGLGEIRRVLAPGGRFIANLPGPAPPPLEIMAEELARHVGPECASFVHLVFSLHDAEEIRALAADAGFETVDVRSAPRELQLPPPADFLWQYVHSTPLAAAVAEVDEERRAALERDFTARCRELVENGPLAGSVRMTTVIATK